MSRSPVDQDLMRNLDQAKRYLRRALDVCSRASRGSDPEARRMQRRAKEAEKVINRALAEISSLRGFADPWGTDPDLLPEDVKARKAREARRARAATPKKDMVARVLESLKVED